MVNDSNAPKDWYIPQYNWKKLDATTYTKNSVRGEDRLRIDIVMILLMWIILAMTVML